MRHNVWTMPKRIPEHELEAIVRAVARCPQGASIDDVMGALEGAPLRRTLQRRLAMMVAVNRLSPVGNGWARRYHVPAPEAGLEYHVDHSRRLHLSPEAEAVRRLVAAPIQQRIPVGYDRSFLDKYRPNESFYLPIDTRERLASLGAVPGEQLPPGTYLRQVFDRLLIDLS
jgi:hypothetical protein